MATFLTEELGYNMVALRFRFSARHQPRRVLVNGSPKSGTTWMLNLVASIPGYRAIGNFNGDIQRYKDVRPGQVVHGHDWWRPELDTILRYQDFRVILMIRDPRDQLISRMFHVRRSKRHNWHSRFQNLSNDEALMLCLEGREELPGAQTMMRIPQSWLQAGFPVLCMRYEDLLADPVARFTDVLAYLNIDEAASAAPLTEVLPRKTVQKPLVALARTIVRRNRFERLAVGRRFWRRTRKRGEEDPNSHYRKGVSGDWHNHLNPTHIQRLKELAGQQLIELGYEHDLNW